MHGTRLPLVFQTLNLHHFTGEFWSEEWQLSDVLYSSTLQSYNICTVVYIALSEKINMVLKN